MAAHGRGDRARGPLEQLVACRVPLSVVDVLQLVQVDHDDGGRVRQLPVALGLVGQQPDPGRAAVHPRELVHVGPQPRLQHLQVQRAALTIGHQGDGEQSRQQQEQRLDAGDSSGWTWGSSPQMAPKTPPSASSMAAPA